MILNLILFSIAFIVGYMIAPVYFILHRKLRIKAKALEEELIHLHHSFYGLMLIAFGLILGYNLYSLAYFLIPIGLGLIVHHERTESGLVGIQKFIYIRRWHKH